MSKPSYLSQPTVLRIPDLLQELRKGIIVIPRFQRPLVWDDQQRLELMESIYAGLPIGSLLVWRTHEQGLQTYRLRGTVEENKRTAEQRQYLLDGHQRVTTLFSALGPGLLPRVLSVDEAGDARDLIADEDDDDSDICPICFDLDKREFTLVPNRSRCSPPAWLLPLSILFDDLRMYEFQENLARKTKDETRRAALVNRTRNLHKTFYDYSIPIVPIIADDLDLVTKSFERVNRSGTLLSEVHMVSALTYVKGFDLNERVQAIRQELGEVGWQDLEEKMILNVCKARLDIDIYGKNIEVLAGELKETPSLLDDAQRAIVVAANFLAEQCGVLGPQTLPYSYHVVLLADVLWRHKSNEKHLAQPLAKWFWLTAYGEYFASMSSSRIRSALEHLRLVAEGNVDPQPPDLASEITPLERFDFRTARSRVMALTFANEKPMPLDNEKRSSYEILAQYGRDAMPKFLSTNETEKRLSDRFENRFLTTPQGSKALFDALRAPGTLSPELLKSHGITKSAAAALKKQDYAEFLRQRRNYFLNIERNFVEEELGLTYVMEEV